MRYFSWSSALLFLFFVVVAGTAHAATLQVDPDAAAWAHIGAAFLLYAHIGGGVVGLISGLAASFSRKGSPLHRTSGKIFLVSMFITYLVGAGVAPFLTEGQRPNFVAGVLALYLLISGVMAAKRRTFTAGRAEVVGLLVAITITGLGIMFMVMGANSESGTVDGSPPQAFYLFILVGSIAAVGELNVLIRKQISQTAGVIRHLWRMCCSFFFASASLFLGQPQVFPDWFNQTPFPFLLAFLPLFIMAFWVIRVRMGKLRSQ